MASLFISYSTRDKEFVFRLGSDLKELGHEVWLDAWKIGVGQDITEEIERGIAVSGYVVIVLSKHSVNSKWVEQEWRPKFLQEIQENKMMILPALLENCEMPTLLKGRRYADFRTGYVAGLFELHKALGEPARDYWRELPEILAFVLDNILPKWELQHLIQLEEDPGAKPKSRYFKNELFRLWGRGYIRERSGRSISNMGPEDRLGDFVRLTDAGETFLEKRRMVLPQREADE